MPTFYAETRVSSKPSAPNTVKDISVSPAGARRWDSSPISPAKAQLDNSLPQRQCPRDEKSFARRYAATQGAFYFRRRKTYPRTFSWRVIDNDRVLDIHAADVTRSVHDATQASARLRFRFTEPILPHGIAITDREDTDILNVFVLTNAPRLYTLTLRPELFNNAALGDEDYDHICTSFKPAPFAFTSPHRIFAVNPNEVFCSLSDGTLLRLRKRAEDDGSNWSLVVFDEKPWGVSFRDLLRWNKHDSIKYNGQSLDLNTANAIAVSPDETFLFVVGLNHTLKVWNLAGQQLITSKDLLGREFDPEAGLSRALNPADSALVRIFTAEQAAENAAFYAVTYSPHEGGQFKFWAIRGGVMTDLIVEDMFPEATLKPADPDVSGSAFWSMADFQIKPTKDGRGMSLWVLWKNGSLHRVYSLHFDLDSLEDAWQTNWLTVATDLCPAREVPASEDWNVEDATEKWTNFLFSPNRYSEEALTTTLLMYQDATNYRTGSAPKTVPEGSSLQQHMTHVVLQTVILRESHEGDGDEINHKKYRTDLDARWRQVWQIAEDVSKSQREVLSLSYDTYVDTPWLTFADGCGVVRECSGTELLFCNPPEALAAPNTSFALAAGHRDLSTELGPRPSTVSTVLHLAASISQELPPQLLKLTDAALKVEIYDDPSMAVSERIARFYEGGQFESLITDDMASDIRSQIAANIAFDKQTTDIFIAIVATLPHRLSLHEGDLVSTPFGHSVVVRGIQDRINFVQEILMSLLFITVFIEMEMKTESGPFDSTWVFTTLIDHLKDYELIRWLYTRREEILAQENSSTAAQTSPAAEGNDSEQPKESVRAASLLEKRFLSSCKPRPVVGVPQTWTLTQHVDDVFAAILGNGPVAVQAVSIQCQLLANGDIAGAADFQRFQPTTAWATYVKGRLYLAQADYATAAVCFEKASYIMSHGKPHGDLVELSASLLDPVAASHFYDGLTRYYQHILGLFEGAHAFSFVADFANLALRALQSEAGANKDSPEYVTTRSDLLSRLFHASLQSSRFDEAWSAVSRYTDTALQNSALTSLISTILTTSGPGKSGLDILLHLPLAFRPGLVSRVDRILLFLSRKQKTINQPQSSDSHEEYTPDYERILETYRVATHDIRGAAELAYQRVQRVSETCARTFQDASEEEQDLEHKELRRELLTLINLLSCMEESEAYILVEKPEPPSPSGLKSQQTGQGSNDHNSIFNSSDQTSSARRASQPPVRRIVVTLADVRRQYQAELDRLSQIENGEYAFGGDPVDEDVEMDMGESIPANGRQSRLDNYAPEASMMDLSA